MPPEIGNVAVLYSTYLLEDTDGSIFEDEADMLEALLVSQDTSVEVMPCETRDDVLNIVRNKQVSSIITIGDGSYSDYWINRKDYNSNPDMLGWQDIAKASTHLKLGYFAHRTCGNFIRKVNLPFTTFLMKSRMEIYGAIGEALENERPDERKIKRIFNDPTFLEMNSKGLYDYGKTINKD